MTLNLPRLARAQGRRRDITLRPIIPTAAAATELAAILAPAWRVWAERADAIMAGYDPAPLPTGDALTLDSSAQIQSAIDTTAAEFLTRLLVTITPALRRWAVNAERVHRSRWVAAVKAGTAIDLGMILTAQPVEETLDAWIGRNVALVRNISDQAQSRISDAVFRGYTERRPAREVAAEIREATGLGRQRALNVATDQLSKLSGALDTERMAEAGLDLWKYRHSGKAHPRSWHRARDGRIYTVKGNRQVNPDGSPMPGGDVIESGDEPTQPPWCACRKQAYLPIMSEIE